MGGPLARLTGTWVDAVSYPVSEVILLLCLGTILLRAISPWLGLNLPFLWWLAPLCLVIMVFSHGVTPVDWVPSVFRDAPHLRAGTVPVDEKVEEWRERVQKRVSQFPDRLYKEAEDSPNLEQVHRGVKRVLSGLSYPPGREVKIIKDMKGLTRLLGLAYDGPAYHDVVTGETVMASDDDLPRTKVSRWLTVVHEIAHAQGFTREMDAEVLTWLILREMESPFAMYCADLQALSKGVWSWKGSAEYDRDRKSVIEARQQLHQPFVSALKKVLNWGGVQNSGEKYGHVESKRPPIDHPFFGVVLKWDREQTFLNRDQDSLNDELIKVEGSLPDL